MIDDQDVAILCEITFRKVRTLQRLEENFRLSRRQIIYTITKINKVLRENKQEVLRVTGDTVHVSSITDHYLQEYLLEPGLLGEIGQTKDKRQLLILLVLSCSMEYLSLDHLILLLNSSRSTVISDLKEVKQTLLLSDIQVSYNRARGYFLVGDEVDIRFTIIQTVIRCLHQDNGEAFLDHFAEKYLDVDYDTIEEKIMEESNHYQISFFENKTKEFTYCFILLYQRLKQTNAESSHIKEVFDPDSNEYRFSQSICARFGINEEANVNYLAAWILGLSTGDINQKTKDRKTIHQLVKGIVLRFENLAGVRFLDQEAVVRRLYEHFRPSYYRILYRLPIVNPLTEKVQQEYGETYSLVKEAIRPLQPLFKRELPADEIAYLTVHLVAATFETTEEHIKRSKALILCPSGIGTSLILLKELESLFPSINFITQNSHEPIQFSDFDIVFSTTITPDILSTKTPFLVVNPILTSKERFELIRRVNQIINEDTLLSSDAFAVLQVLKKHVSKDQYETIESEVRMKLATPQSQTIPKEGGGYPLLSEITNVNLITLNVEASNWEEAIRKSTVPLVETGKVLPSYIDGMIETTKETGPYIVITKHVALPHARPESGAKEIAISIATLKEPVVFGNSENDPVKYVFGLSALDNQTHLTAMAELASLLDQPAFYSLLDQAKTPEEIYDYIIQFESEETL